MDGRTECRSFCKGISSGNSMEQFGVRTELMTPISADLDAVLSRVLSDVTAPIPMSLTSISLPMTAF